MKNKISKTEAKSQIESFFSKIKSKTPKEIKKVKKLSMSHNLKLKQNKKLFCKKCLVPYVNQKIRIKNGIKSVACEKCGFVKRWKINLS